VSGNCEYSTIKSSSSSPSIMLTYFFILLITIVSVLSSSVNSKVRTRFSAFEKTWAQKNIISPNVQHDLFDWAGGKVTGLVAQKGFQIGDDIIKLPVTEVIGVLTDSVDEKEIPKGFESLWSNVKGLNRLSIKLCTEYLMGENSYYYSYISSLPEPESLDTPIHWSEDKLASFPYLAICTDVELRRQRWNNLYDEVRNINSDITKKRFIWAMEMVRSRAFNGVGDLVHKTNVVSYTAVSAGLLVAATAWCQLYPYSSEIGMVIATLAALVPVPLLLESNKPSCVLLPVIDSCNHKSSDYQASLNFVPIKGCFTVQCTSPISSGSEVTISYGKRNNDDLFLSYGFVERDNPFDLYRVDMDRNGNGNGNGSGSESIVVNTDSRDTWIVPDRIDTLQLSRILDMDYIRLRDWLEKDSELFTCIDKLFIREKLQVLSKALSTLEKGK